MEIRARPASAGIAIGRAYLLKKNNYKPSSALIKPEDVEVEINRFTSARDLSVRQIEQIYKEALEKMGEEKADLFQGYIEILVDDDLKAEIIEKIRKDLMTAETATDIAFKNAIEEVKNLDDTYLSGRADDLKDLGQRLICNIAGVPFSEGAPALKDNTIIVGNDISPSDFAQMDLSSVVGLICEIGGVTSHVAIMAQALAIPAVVGAAKITEYISDDNFLILDGEKGVIIDNPSELSLAQYKEKQRLCEEEKQHLSALVGFPAITQDGRRIELLANIGSDKDVESAIKNGADGIGLFRTEFLCMDRTSLPSEEEQFNVYKKVAQAMNGKKVIIRTFDIGGDKPLPCIDFQKEDNPFLGWRAVRIYNDYPEMIKMQLRAILRASDYGCIKIMFPMIISVEEVQDLKRLLAELKMELSKENIAFDKNIEIGVMIETPAAALISDVLAQEVDFFSIGTNDLTQYTLAVDRGNNRIANLYNSLHPSVIRLIKIIVDNAHAKGKSVGMCGELAGDSNATAILLGLGLDELSMSAGRIGKIKSIVRKISYKNASHLGQEVYKAGSSTDISKILSKVNYGRKSF
jgi:phosphotransferase system enzyme I (PtsI)